MLLSGVSAALVVVSSSGRTCDDSNVTVMTLLAMVMGVFVMHNR